MTKLSAIREANAALKSEQRRGVVAVFVGATSGIGLHTLRTTVTLFADPTVYVVGRSEARFADHRAELERLNPGARVVFLQADVSLLADVDAACDRIAAAAAAAAETKVDYLYMSPGLIPINGPQHTREGLDTCFALSYYARVRFVEKLAPLLRGAPAPRVLSVLAAGREGPLVEDDLGLEDEKNWSTGAVMRHTTTLTSLALEHLARQHGDIVFLHAFPGLVRTDIFARLEAPPGSSWLWKLAVLLVSRGVTALMWLRGITPEESGERQAWHLTSPEFTREGGRLHQVNEHSDEIAPSAMKVFEDYKQEGWPERVWEYTARVIERALIATQSA
ncbi:hypothetical protein MYCTH_2090608 [Thermothelomyces thermophilus ATCC 42464]|uniref:Short-chain dehydrogenase/reductase-like protein n=1 Tax=Thermothelomyces thermophilus (strain ATCC 42464 / BCRC 31852 / DSM 1799) TaxID=573729 RepID=G2Q9P1_THET4|nr:uncharacterized protein MYCTH_2090608 [Thermothelomyces thermophilus ATCC 42464]AEO56500.1 hypothetical protein MYCTH_2090608 [Thermothelomyces thermophilus ATCC 42464]